MEGNRRTQGGVTLTELMIAMVIMAVVTAQALLLFSNQQSSYASQGAVSEIQKDARLVTEMILSDIRMAGFLVPTYAGLSGMDGGANGPDVLCVSDPSIMDTDAIITASGRLTGATLSDALGAGHDRVKLVASSMDIDGDGNATDDFVAGNGIIISDGNRHHCARISGFTAGSPDIDPRPPAGFAIAAGAGRAVPAIIYQLDDTGLLRNSILLSRYVENLQFEYAVDINGDGSIGAGEFPVHDIVASDPDEIRGVQISVMTRTANEDPANLGSRMPIAGNHVAGARDNFLRRRFTSNAVPRNL
jgi:prepilin-type N-terminal cleavage/methylation domain-containing protein